MTPENSCDPSQGCVRKVQQMGEFSRHLASKDLFLPWEGEGEGRGRVPAVGRNEPLARAATLMPAVQAFPLGLGRSTCKAQGLPAHCQEAGLSRPNFAVSSEA